MKRFHKLWKQGEAAVMRFLTSIYVLFALVATAVYAYWRMRHAWASGSSVQVQNAASWFQTIAMFIAAIITWAYVRTTERTLQVMRDVPEVIIEVRRASMVVNGTEAYASMLLRATNLSAGRLAILHAESAQISLLKACHVGFSAEGLTGLVGNTEVNPGTTNLQFHATVEIGSTPLLPRMPLTVKLTNLSAGKELAIECEARVSQMRYGRVEEVPEPESTNQ